MLVQGLIDKGDLVLFSEPLLPVDHTCHLAHTVASVKRPHVRAVVDWLRSSLAPLA